MTKHKKIKEMEDYLKSIAIDMPGHRNKARVKLSRSSKVKNIRKELADLKFGKDSGYYAYVWMNKKTPNIKFKEFPPEGLKRKFKGRKTSTEK